MFDQKFIRRFEKNILKKPIKAHRVAMLAYKHINIDEHCVLHTCDNPSCVNPEHLYLGTQKENANDRKQRKRGGNLKGENNGRAKLTRNLVIEIRNKFKTGRFTKKTLAKEFGVTDVQIGKIIRGEAWK